jgi:branched-chain amino acid transport system substrate-binding protein
MIHIIGEAVEKTGSLDPDAIVPALEKTAYIGPSGKYMFTEKTTASPHDVKFGPGLMTGVVCQWQEGKLETIWPPADGSVEGIVYEGVVKPKLPPWMVQALKK